MLAVVMLMNTETTAGLIGVFAALGAGLGGFQMSAQNMVLEFGARSDLPVRIALANSAQEFIGFLGPLIGGALAVAFSKQDVIAIAIACQLAATALVVRLVVDPRHRTIE